MIGVTLVDNKIFALHEYSERIVVFANNHPFERLEDIVVKGMQEPRDIVACSDTMQLFVSDWLYEGVIWRVDVKSTDKVNKFIETEYTPDTMSVTSRRLLVTPLYADRWLRVYDVVDGKLLQRVELPSFMNPWHAVETQRGTFIVCHTGQPR